MSLKRQYKSVFTDMLTEYVAHRKMQGYKFVTSEQNLFQLDAYIHKIGWDSLCLRKELVEEYVAPLPGEKRATQAHRVSAIRCFAKYLADTGRDAYIIPAGTCPVSKYIFDPYIFSEREIARLVEAFDSLGYCASSPQRHLVMPMLIKVMYGCGLRISEARQLLISDVNLELGVLFIRATKFNKDRYVPMTPSLQKQCGLYASQMHAFRNSSSPFFPSPRKGFYHRVSIGHTFRQCLHKAGIPHTDDGPTVHSLRHSFAVHRLAKWSQSKEDVTALLPYLSIYLGHESLLGTQRYLRMTAEMYPDLWDRAQKTCSWIMPEVDRGE